PLGTLIITFVSGIKSTNNITNGRERIIFIIKPATQFNVLFLKNNLFEVRYKISPRIPPIKNEIDKGVI
ncbi:hypothetical protein Q604_UNBC10587G0001, partial [human gut metagenome]